MLDRGYLVEGERGVPALRDFFDNRPDGVVYLHFYDATHPGARDYLWQQIDDHYYQHGVRVWWLDAAEPETHPIEPDNMRYYLGNGLEVGNLYPMLHAKGFYDGMRAKGETEILTLNRSAWAGSQRYGAAVWSGDVASTFAALRKQIPAGLNIGLSGIPWWTTDIGGFHGGNVNDPEFRELLVRWFQYGVFCPICRLHGHRQPAGEESGADNEVWSFGDKIAAILSDLLALRERLRPYVMAQMSVAAEEGLPPMRPLFVDFPDDPFCGDVGDAYMFGPDLLVAPVTAYGARSREIYLPEGAMWTDAWTGECLDGGQTIEAAAPLDRIPLYLRDDAVLPIRA
jgi:alpha-D-xyloside xylohydrolase